MGGYAKVGPFVNATTPPGVSAVFLNGIESVLARGVGETETGKYVLNAGLYQTGAFVSEYRSTISRTSVPVSVVIDTADLAPVSINAPSTGFLTANGFQTYSTATGAGLNCRCAGNTTVTY
jgi:hypothetical protein